MSLPSCLLLLFILLPLFLFPQRYASLPCHYLPLMSQVSLMPSRPGGQDWWWWWRGSLFSWMMWFITVFTAPEAVLGCCHEKHAQVVFKSLRSEGGWSRQVAIVSSSWQRLPVSCKLPSFLIHKGKFFVREQFVSVVSWAKQFGVEARQTRRVRGWRVLTRRAPVCSCIQRGKKWILLKVKSWSNNCSHLHLVLCCSYFRIPCTILSFTVPKGPANGSKFKRN